MDHVAIDLGARESQICVRSAGGEILRESRCSTVGLRRSLAELPPSRVILETCAEAFAVAEWAKAAGHEVVVVPASLVRALGVGARGIKTDIRDARNLSEASCRMSRLPQVHVPSAPSRHLKELCTLRESLVDARTKLINTARAWLRGQGLGRFRRGYADGFSARLAEFYRGKTGQGLPPALQRQVAAIDALTTQMLDAEKELVGYAKDDEVCRLLMSMPGVGAIIAVRFCCAIDDVSRFPNAHALQSYIGLVPGENSSSDTKRSTGITKAGSPKVRWVLQQAAWTLWRCRPTDPLVLWAEAVAKRRGRKIAATALARRIAGVLFALWRDGSRYDPSRVGMHEGASPMTVSSRPTAPPPCAP